MNDEPERIGVLLRADTIRYMQKPLDTAEADESPSPSEEGMMVSSRVSQVVDRLVSQLREAQQSRLRVEVGTCSPTGKTQHGISLVLA